MTRMTSLVAALGLMALCAACPAREVSKVDPNQQRTEYVDVPVEVNRNIDILLVIDNSGSMSEEQTSLASNFQTFIDVLEAIEGGLPNVHIGVISTDVGISPFSAGNCSGSGDNGLLQNTARVSGCTPPAELYISDVEDPNGGPRITNYSGTLAETFSCIAQLGTDGCGYEQHFESMKRALDSSNNQNTGFLRSEAFLAVIFITDEDDCSASDPQVFHTTAAEFGAFNTGFRCVEYGVQCDGSNISRSAATYGNCEPRTDSYIADPQDYVDFLKNLKTNDENVIVAGIVGTPTPFSVSLNGSNNPEVDPSCQSGVGKAFPSVRFRYFLEQFPNRNTFTSICKDDLSAALVVVAELLATVIGSPCLRSNVDQEDLFPQEPGLQIDCQVSDVVDPTKSSQDETPLPRCEMIDDSTPDRTASTLPCWWVVQDPVECPDTPTNLILNVERSSDPPIGTHIIAKCLVL